MKLTKLQLSTLMMYEHYQTRPPTFLNVARLFLRSWFVLALIAGVSYWYVWAGWPVVGWICMGVCVGAILRDVNRIRVLVETWPIIQQTIHWERVRELLDENETRAA